MTLMRAFRDTGKCYSVTVFCVGPASTFGWPMAYY